MRALYTWLLRVASPYVLARLLWRGVRNRGYWQRIPERFGFIPRVAARRVIWIHAVSVGEVRAAVPLVKALSARYPEHRILITTMTPTGAATVSALFDNDVDHRYAPYDLPAAVTRFLDQVRPDIAIVMETELWPNTFALCRARSIPICVANLRMSQAAVERYLRVPRLARATLENVAVLAAQSAADAERLYKLGAPRAAVHVTGSIKFEMSLPASLREAAEVLRGQWGRDRPVWLAASTHDGEEEPVLAARAELTRRFPDHLLVLVPRHPERFALAARLARKRGNRVALWSERRGPVRPDVGVVIGDTMGELQLFYAAADVAFVGGSLVPVGGHNLLEASAVGTPVVFGPHTFNFEEIAAMALERGAGVRIKSAAQLAPALSDFLGNANRRFEAGERGKKMVDENRGAVARTLRLIETLLPPSRPT